MLGWEFSFKYMVIWKIFKIKFSNFMIYSEGNSFLVLVIINIKRCYKDRYWFSKNDVCYKKKFVWIIR